MKTIFSKLEIEYKKELISMNLDNNYEIWMYPSYITELKLPRQGFKIHVSATITNATHILRTIKSFLHSEKIAYKVIKNLYELSNLNKGIYGMSQIGKFMTIYPTNDIHAKYVANCLNPLVEEYCGPKIFSDYKLFGANSILYYRFGVIDPGNKYYEIEKDILRFGNKIVFDTRSPENVVPKGITDIFSDMKFVGDNEKNKYNNEILFKNKYIITNILRIRGKGSVFRAINIESNPPRKVIIKTANKLGEVEPSGVDAKSRLKWEYSLYKKLKCTKYKNKFPKIYEFFEETEVSILIQEDLGEMVLKSFIKNNRINYINALKFAISLLDVIDYLHNNGIILNDLSLDNIVLKCDDASSFGLIDLEFAHHPKGPAYFNGSGTPGFYPIKKIHKKGLYPSKSDDLYAVISILYTLLSPKGYITYMNETTFNKSSMKNFQKAYNRSPLPNDLPKYLCAFLLDQIADCTFSSANSLKIVFEDFLNIINV